MSIAVMTNLWKNSTSGGTELLLLLAIADFANDEGVAFPSMATLAGKIRMSERNTQYLLSKLVAKGELDIERNAGPHGCNLYRVQALRGAKTAGVQCIAPGGATGSAKGVKATAPKPSKNRQRTIKEGSTGNLDDASEVHVHAAIKVRTRGQTLSDYIEQCTKLGTDPIPADSAPMVYAESAGIPLPFVALAWRVFKRRYLEDSPGEMYKDWIAHFRNAVSKNWYRLWWHDSKTNAFALTTAGLQEQNVLDAEGR